MQKLIFVFLILIGLSACDSYEKVLKSKDIDYKFTKANEYYEAGKWFDANMIYESLLPVIRGTKNYDELYYRYTYSFYNMHDYVNAAYQFKNYTEFFSSSPRVQEMEFMYAKSLYLAANKSSLDQSNTEKSIAALQTFINQNTASKYRDSALDYMDSALEKLEIKNADAAYQYYVREQYKAAQIAYQTLIYDYPDSKQLDYYYFMVMKSMMVYADYSRESVQEDRYINAINYYDNLKNYFPQSTYTKEGLKLVNQGKKNLDKLKAKKAEEERLKSKLEKNT